MKKIKLKPSKKELKVFNPKNGSHLNEDGELVELTTYWRRQIKSGDVVEVVEEKKEKKKQSKKSNNDFEKESEE